MQIAPLHYPHLSHTEIFDSVETFYKRFYFRAGKIASIVGEMVRSPEMMKRRLREGVEFFQFLREREMAQLSMRRLIVCADDFGLDAAVNEAVETAHRDGILTCASLMVGAPAAADAVARARRLPRLRVGLHLVLVDGKPVLPRRAGSAVSSTQSGAFDDNMLRAGFRFFFSRGRGASSPRRSARSSRRSARPASRSTMSTRTSTCISIRRSPRSIVAIGRDYRHARGARAGRAVDAAAPRRRGRGRARRAAALCTVDRAAAPPPAPRRPRRQRPSLRPCLERRHDRAARAAPARHAAGRAPASSISIPRRRRRAALARAMPAYRPAEELAALLSPAVRRLVDGSGIELVSYADLVAAP